MKKYTPAIVIFIIAVIIYQSVKSGDERPGQVKSPPGDYEIVRGSSSAKLQENVKSEMLFGWQPLGGITVTADGLLQPMVR